MKKIISIISLMACSTVAQAEQLVLIWQSPDRGVSQYVDMDDIARNGDLVEMWRVFNYKPPYLRSVNRVPYTSQRVRTEFDCESMALRQIYASWHAEDSGKGAPLVETSEPELWEFSSNNEFTGPLWKIACGR